MWACSAAVAVAGFVTDHWRALENPVGMCEKGDIVLTVTSPFFVIAKLFEDLSSKFSEAQVRSEVFGTAMRGVVEGVKFAV
jgi:hypothetical protein